jgi:two-component system OmpR family response regulator
MAEHLLVVDDDREIRKLLMEYLEQAGYRVSAVADGKAMRRMLDAHRVDLVILDLMLPGEDGLALCRALRAESPSLPILMLTARGEDTDRIVGLEMGADDYLPKPFNPRELLARIRSILRRAGENAVREAPARALAFAGWTLDLGARHLVGADGVVVPISNGEFKLLRAFAENPFRVLSRDQLMDVLAGREAGPFDRSVDVMVHRLRRRLDDDAREPR